MLIQGPHKVQRCDLKSLSLVDREKLALLGQVHFEEP